jgi:hypothetical protein
VRFRGELVSAQPNAQLGPIQTLLRRAYCALIPRDGLADPVYVLAQTVDVWWHRHLRFGSRKCYAGAPQAFAGFDHALTLIDD